MVRSYRPATLLDHQHEAIHSSSSATPQSPPHSSQSTLIQGPNVTLIFHVITIVTCVAESTGFTAIMSPSKQDINSTEPHLPLRTAPRARPRNSLSHNHDTMGASAFGAASVSVTCNLGSCHVSSSRMVLI